MFIFSHSSKLVNQGFHSHKHTEITNFWEENVLRKRKRTWTPYCFLFIVPIFASLIYTHPNTPSKACQTSGQISQETMGTPNVELSVLHLMISQGKTEHISFKKRAHLNKEQGKNKSNLIVNRTAKHLHYTSEKTENKITWKITEQTAMPWGEHIWSGIAC